MGATAPIVYLLNGDDEYGIAEFIDELEGKLGDPATASMNTTRLDGNTFNLDQLPSITNAMPFLARRRLVILTHPLARLSSPGAKSAQNKFIELLDRIPDTTALVLVEYRLLTADADRNKGKVHWLERWALVRAFRAPRGAEMAKRIQVSVKKSGGQITREAADLLALMVDNDPRLADKEIEKLLAYVNYKRPIEFDDVQALTVDSGQGDIFALVDALSKREARRAMEMLQRLLEYGDYYAIFGMIARQFRLLILAREVIDQGGQKGDIQRELRQHPYVAEKLLGQARFFALPELERVYHRLVEMDEAVKTSQVPDRLALELFVSEFTTQQPLQTSR
jgi:DNA polymerase-3 subunit delta